MMKERESQLKKAMEAKYDVAVIGGGINGAGIAMDLACRGFKTILLEKKDFGSYATSASTKLIHGGLRYLEFFEFSLVRESLVERERLLINASHLVKPLKLNVPIYAYQSRPAWMIRIGLFLYDLFSFNKSLPKRTFHYNNKKNRDSGEIDKAYNQEGLKAVGTYYDCQVAFPERLALELILAAQEEGALTLNYSEVLERRANEDGNTQQLSVYDALTGKTFGVETEYVVNAGGPLVDDVNGRLMENVGRQMGGTKGSHLLVNQFSGGPEEAIYVEAVSDGRPFFIIPWRQYYLIGTTDNFFDGEMDAIEASEDEIKYLLDEFNHLVPKHPLRRKDVVYTYSGIRPLPYEPGKSPRAVTRRHIILDHAKEKASKKTYSVIGGKLTTFRSLAEELVDILCKDSHSCKPCETGNLKLPGARLDNFSQEHFQMDAEFCGLLPASSQHLMSFYGSLSKKVLSYAQKDRSLAEQLVEGRPEIKAEIVYTVMQESAKTLEDIFIRRTTLGSYEDRGFAALHAIIQILIHHFNMDEATLNKQAEQLFDRKINGAKVIEKQTQNYAGHAAV